MAPKLSSMIESGMGLARISFGSASDAQTAADLASAFATCVDVRASESGVAAVLSNDSNSTGLILASVIGGTRLISLPVPSRTTDIDRYIEFIRQACVSEGVSRVVARDDIASLLNAYEVETVSHSALGRSRLAVPRPDGFELVQFSSGTTGDPKGVRLSDATLGINVEAMLRAIEPRPGDRSISWLPLSHDMGLVGMLFTSLAAASSDWVGGLGELLLLEPETFLRRPLSWMQAAHERGSTFSAAPDFGLQLLNRHLEISSAAGRLDLSSLRCIIVGGEIVRPSTLLQTESHLSAANLSDLTFCPSYGMAEVGVGVSMTSPGERWKAGRVDLSFDDDSDFGRASADPASFPVASSGTPIPGYSVETDYPTGVVGPLRIVAPAMGLDSDGSQLTASDGDFYPGDIGFLDDTGSVFVVGRNDDYFVTAARKIFAPEVEAAVSEIAAVRTGRVAVGSSPTGPWTIACETAAGVSKSPDDLRRIAKAVRAASVRASGVSPDVVSLVSPGSLPFTSSGKLQRRELVRRWLADDLDSLWTG